MNERDWELLKIVAVFIAFQAIIVLAAIYSK